MQQKKFFVDFEPIDQPVNYTPHSKWKLRFAILKQKSEICIK